MVREPVRILLTLAAVAAAIATVVFANLDMTLGTAVAALVAVGLVVEGWRHTE